MQPLQRTHFSVALSFAILVHNSILHNVAPLQKAQPWVALGIVTFVCKYPDKLISLVSLVNKKTCQ